MILADKIIALRKKNGWSQEEFAEKMNVSRQAVSKWEGAQSVPDIEKILLMSRLFGVTTDYLLKAEIEFEEFTEEDIDSVKKVSLEEAGEFIEWRRSASVKIAIASFICIVSVIPLIILGVVSEYPEYGLSEDFAGAVGMISMISSVAVAVAIFVNCGLRNAPYDFLDEKKPFELEYGVRGLVEEHKKSYRRAYNKSNVAGACLCVISPIALFIGSFTGSDLFTVIMLAFTMLIAGSGVMLFIIAGVRWASFQKILREGDFEPVKKKKTSIKETVGIVYWLFITAIFLAWTLSAEEWRYGCLIWPVAAIVFIIVMVIADQFIDGDK